MPPWSGAERGHISTPVGNHVRMPGGRHHGLGRWGMLYLPPCLEAERSGAGQYLNLVHAYVWEGMLRIPYIQRKTDLSVQIYQ